MKRCKVCRKKPGLERRVNSEGVVFCSDDCYDDFDGEHNDNDHPYIDDYDAVRFEYIEWMKNYEDDLYKYWLFGSTRKEDLIEGIESVIDEFDDYIQLEGSDGSFSKEIYEYLIALNELKIVISKWEVDLKELKKRRKVLKDSRSKVTD